MSKIRRAIIHSSLTRYCLRLLGLASTMLVSRLLTPEEIGTFAVASAVVMLMSEFRMLGAGGYLVREDELSTGKIRSALGLTMLISWGLGLIILVGAIPASRFYELPAIASIFAILSFSFFLAPYISLPMSLLARRLEFRTQMKVQLASSVAGFVVTIGLILMGFSYYALALGQTAIASVNFLMLCRLRPPEMVWKPQFTGLKPVASFGVFNSLGNFFSKSMITLPDMIIGKMGTTAQVGLFSRGLGLISFLSQTILAGISPVALPFLSQTRRDSGNVAGAYIRASSMVGALVVPVLVVASIASLPAIRVFFGDQWDAAAPLAAWLGVWGALRSVFGFSNELMLTIRREKAMVVKEGVIFAALIVAIITSFRGGLEGIAQGFVVVGILELVITGWMVKTFAHVSMSQFAKAWIPNLIITGGCASMTVLIGYVIDFNASPAWQPVLAIAAIMPPLWFLLLRLCRHPLFEEIRRALSVFFGRRSR